MKTAAEIRAGVGTLVALQFVVAFATIGLLVRMSPAIGHVLSDNVSSITAVEGMYAAVAMRDCGLTQAEAEARFEDALSAARANTSLADEAPLIGNVESEWRDAMSGNCEARDRLGASLDEIADLNRTEIASADRTARQLGAAGAWTTAILGLIAFGVSAAIVRQFTARIAVPLAEIEAVLLAASQGDPYRRCRRIDAPGEYVVIAQRLNQLLDRRLARDEDEDPQIRALDRALLQHLLDRIPEPCVAVDRSGAVVAANDKAMDVLAGSGIDSLADALSIGPDGDPETSLITRVEAFGKAQGFLVQLRSLPPEPATEEQARAMAEGAVLSEAAVLAAAGAPTARRFTLEAFADRGPSEAEVVPPSPPDPKGKPDWQRD